MRVPGQGVESGRPGAAALRGLKSGETAAEGDVRSGGQRRRARGLLAPRSGRAAGTGSPGRPCPHLVWPRGPPALGDTTYCAHIIAPPPPRPPPLDTNHSPRQHSDDVASPGSHVFLHTDDDAPGRVRAATGIPLGPAWASRCVRDTSPHAAVGGRYEDWTEATTRVTQTGTQAPRTEEAPASGGPPSVGGTQSPARTRGPAGLLA